MRPTLCEMLSIKRTRMKLEKFMEIASVLSTFSYDDKWRVGTIIITDDFREICAIGYNGNYRGGPNQRDSLEFGQSGFLHSEENALLHLSKDYDLRSGLILICTHEPCPMCAKRIINSGISRVLYRTSYPATSDETQEIFQIAGVDCQQFE